MTVTRTDLRADIGEILLTEEQIQTRVTELGAAITADYRGRAADARQRAQGLPAVHGRPHARDRFPLRIDLMEVSSYGGATTESSGLVRILKDLSASIEGEDVLIVEDIIDTGLTLNYLVRYLRGKKPASLRICTLLDKPARRLVEIEVDYRGFTIPDQFVVGYGLDYGELYRNLRFVGVLRPEVYTTEGMSMHRRPVGRSGSFASLGAIVALVGCFLPWWTRRRDRSAADHRWQCLRFLRHPRLHRRDRDPGARHAAVRLRAPRQRGSVADLRRLRRSGLAPDLSAGSSTWGLSQAFSFRQPADALSRIPGLWVAGIGLAILARAIYDMARERRLR